MLGIRQCIFGGLMVLIAACGQQQPPVAAQSPAPEAGPVVSSLSTPPRAAITEALSHPDRLADDLERDAGRQPEAVLDFFELSAGSTVLDMFSGGGYYTEILARAVGGEGRVWSHNNTPYTEFAKDELEKRYTEDRLTNVERFIAENNELSLPENSFDTVLLILAYHDLYYIDPANGWDEIDGPALLAEIHKAMKSGGVLGVVDHAAQVGAPRESGGTLHRIDPALLKQEIVAAGFDFDGELDALRNPEDDRSKPMFAAEVRGKTDRFVYRFRKP